MLLCATSLLTGRLARRLDALPFLVEDRGEALLEAPPGNIRGTSRRRPGQGLQRVLRLPGLAQVSHDQVSHDG
jgi:hypothetical protein